MPEARPLPTELLPLISALVVSHFITLTVCAIFYFNFVLWGDYIGTIGWAVLIGEALQSSKQAVTSLLKHLSGVGENPPKRMLYVLVEMMIRPKVDRSSTSFTGYGNTAMGIGHRALLGLGLFSLMSMFSLMLHLLGWWLMFSTSLTIGVPATLLFLVIDRRIFAYRRIISDDTVATLLVISVLFLCSGFIFLFLGTESVLEGLAVAGRASDWVKGALDHREVKEALAEHIDQAADFVRRTVQDMEESYNGTLWWAPVSDMVNSVLQSGKFAAEDDGNATTMYKGLSAALPGGGGWSLEGRTPWEAAQAFWGQMEEWDISVSDLLGYASRATMGGAKMGNLVVNLFNAPVAVLVILFGFGFRFFLFFLCVWYILSQESLVERMVRDLLPIQADKKTDAVRVLRQSIEGVFFCIPLCACFHGAITLAIFTLLGLEFPFFCTFLSVVFSVLPVVDPWLVCLPWVAVCFMNGNVLRGVLLLVAQFYIPYTGKTWIINAGVSGPNAFLTYLTVLSIFTGFAVFGAQGVFAGPLVLVLGTLIYKSLDFLASSLPGSGKPKSMRDMLRHSIVRSSFSPMDGVDEYVNGSNRRADKDSLLQGGGGHDPEETGTTSSCDRIRTEPNIVHHTKATEIGAWVGPAGAVLTRQRSMSEGADELSSSSVVDGKGWGIGGEGTRVPLHSGSGLEGTSDTRKRSGSEGAEVLPMAGASVTGWCNSSGSVKSRKGFPLLRGRYSKKYV